MSRLRLLTPLRFEASAARRAARAADVIRTGMGAQRAQRCAGVLAARLDPTDPVAIVGLCGALDPELAPGDIVVANEVRATDGSVTLHLAGAELLVGELVAMGLPARCGVIVSTDSVVRGPARRDLNRRGAVAVDMESAWLAPALNDAAPDRPLAVVRVVVDTPSRELWSWRTPANLRLSRRRICAVVPVLEQWAQVAGPRQVVLAGPRSFCAGVERAIEIVERAIDRFGPPVYVRRQIVHNTHVVGDLERRGAVFVQEVDDVPDGAVVVLAAHGVAPEVRAAAAQRDLRVIDATCPLVAKVHSEARRYNDAGYDIVLIGHRDHEEIEGTLGEARDRITVVATPADVDALDIGDPERVAYLTQTTLAIDEVRTVVDRLHDRFPMLEGPRRDDVCYASQNRQHAVAAIAPDTDLVLVVGSANSSNSRRLTEVAARCGTAAHLVDGCDDIRLAWLDGATTIGLTAGASAPESKVQEVVNALAALGAVTVYDHAIEQETVSFSLPSEVR